MATFCFDDASRRVQRDVIIGGSPLRIFRLSPAGVAVADAISAGVTLPNGHPALTRRLLDAGVIHPVRPAQTVALTSPADVSVVIPCFRGNPARAVSAATAAHVAEVVVVDDGSPHPLRVDGATVVRLPQNRGPGAARNAGLHLVTTPFVAFLDADTAPLDGWLTGLLWLFDDDRVGLVAPRVMSRSGPTLLERYESWRSPLDLGPQRARIRAGTRVSYVPAAALVIRTAALREIGGFEESLRYGEDVDMLWRLDRAGWTCRYEPDAVVEHDPRPTLGRWISQRVAYGSSAAVLDRRHPNELAPTRTSRWSALIWALVGAGHPILAGAVGSGTIVALARKLRYLERPAGEAIRLAGRGNVFSGRLFASALTRAWWPIAIVASLFSRRARRVLAAAATVAPLYDWLTEHPSLDPVSASALRLADDLSYGAGLWKGMIGERRWGPIIPLFPELTKPDAEAAPGNLRGRRRATNRSTTATPSP
jgi:mycofactocin glycosyltransferase